MIDMAALQKISYFMDHEHPVLGQVSEYHVFMNGRLVMKALAQIEDDKCLDTGDGAHAKCFPIWLSRYNDTDAIRLDEAHAYKKVNDKGVTRISSDSVKAAVSTVLPWALVELYVPKN